MKTLQVAPDVTLPIAMLADSTTIFGRKRSGKSNNAAVIVEEALDAGAQVIVLDPKGDWWGILSSADGKSAGYPVVVIGGKHATVTLNVGAGAATAAWIKQTGYSVVIDLQGLETHDIERFCSAFLKELRRLQEENPKSILLVVDEADELAPEDQRARLQIIRTMGLLIWCVKRGGFAGVGTICITQRPASLSKNITTQSETIIVLHVQGSQDLDAVADGLKHHVEGDTKKERTAALEDLLREVVKLDKGATIIVSATPGLKGVIHRVQFRRRRTFDSGATPEFGKAARQPTSVAKVDLQRLSEAMTLAVAEVAENDPKVLRERIRAQLAQMAKMDATITRMEKAGAVAAPKVVQVPVLKDAQVAKLAGLAERLDKTASAILVQASEIVASVRSAAPAKTVVGLPVGAPVRATAPAANPHRPSTEKAATSQPVRSGESRRTAEPSGEGGLTSTHQAILNAALFLESVGFRSPSVPQLALTAGLSPTGGYWRQMIGRLRTLGYVAGTSLTATGRSQAVQEPISGAEDVQARVRAVLPSSTHQAVYDMLLAAYPDGLAQDDERLPKGGYGRQIVGRLRSLGVAGKGWPLVAAPFLFLEEAA